MLDISWLHFSDLHIGHLANTTSWPTIQTLIKDDLIKIIDKTGKIDFVIFSGDLTYAGEQTQFNDASRFLESIWEIFKKYNCEPYFLCVPGNHDLVRPNEDDPCFIALKNSYNETAVQHGLWENSNSAYCRFIKKAFSNYSEWEWSQTKYKPFDFRQGYIPGDFSCTIEKGNYRIGVVGINSSFLHFHNGDCTNRLCISPHQLNRVTNDDPDQWCRNNTLSILVTHHGSDWLTDKAKEDFHTSIYTQGRFFAHFFGHMHKSYTLEASEGGSKPRRYRQGVSLFGTDIDRSGFQRIHGYCAHIVKADGPEKIIETVLPRKAYLGQDKTLKIIANPDYNLNNEVQILRHEFSAPACIPETASNGCTSEQIEIVINDNEVSRDIGKAIQSAIYNKTLSENHHAQIRTNELDAGQTLLANSSYIWVHSEWGYGKEGFINALAKRSAIGEESFIAKIDCDDADCIESVFRCFRKQTNLELHEFIANIRNEQSVFVVFDNVHKCLINESGTELVNIANVIKDAASKTRVMFLSDSDADIDSFNAVKIKPLDRHETEIYIRNCKRWENIRLDQDTIEIIHARTSGVPMLIDHIVEQLKYVSIGDIVPFERKIGQGSTMVPQALRTALTTLETSTKPSTSRALYLLKVLSLLPCGETLRRIKYTSNSNPIHSSSAAELEAFSLIEVSSKSVTFTFGSGEWLARFNYNEPLLKVQRQVREFVLSTLQYDEKLDILSRLFAIYFGDSWRTGKILMPSKQELGGRARDISGPGNEYELIRYMLTMPHTGSEDLSPVLRVATSYCLRLMDADRYRDVVTITKDMHNAFQSLNADGLVDVYLARARSLRMISRYDESIDIIDNMIDENKLTTKAQRCDAYLTLALAHMTCGNTEQSKEAALNVMKNSDKNSSPYMHAAEILIELRNDDNSVVDMIAHEKACRNRKHTIVANNAALWISRNGISTHKLEYLQNIINSKNDTYNMIIAAAEKLTYIYESAPEFKHRISNRERDIIRYGYTLNFSQRMSGAFSKCHTALWHILDEQNRSLDLFRLFRHSSLVWRLSNRLDIEKKFCLALRSILRTKSADEVLLKSRDYGYFQAREHCIDCQG